MKWILSFLLIVCVSVGCLVKQKHAVDVRNECFNQIKIEYLKNNKTPNAEAPSEWSILELSDGVWIVESKYSSLNQYKTKWCEIKKDFVLGGIYKTKQEAMEALRESK